MIAFCSSYDYLVSIQPAVLEIISCVKARRKPYILFQDYSIGCMGNCFVLDCNPFRWDSDVEEEPLTKVHGILYFATFISKESNEIKKQLQDILKTAKSMNAKFKVTGAMAVYEDANKETRVLQFIEGSKKRVRRLMNNIEKDKRIRDCKIGFEDDFQERFYPDWSMKFCSYKEFQEIRTKLNMKYVDYLFCDNEFDDISNKWEDEEYDMLE